MEYLHPEKFNVVLNYQCAFFCILQCLYIILCHVYLRYNKFLNFIKMTADKFVNWIYFSYILNLH